MLPRNAEIQRFSELRLDLSLWVLRTLLSREELLNFADFRVSFPLKIIQMQRTEGKNFRMVWREGMLGSRAGLAGFAGLAASSVGNKLWNCHLDKANRGPKGFETCKGQKKRSLGMENWENVAPRVGKMLESPQDHQGDWWILFPTWKSSPHIPRHKVENQNLKMEFCTKCGAGIFPEIKGLREWISEGEIHLEE